VRATAPCWRGTIRYYDVTSSSLSSLIIALFKTSRRGFAESSNLDAGKTGGANRWRRECVRGNMHSLCVSIRVNYYVRASIRNANICRSWGGSRNPHLHECRWDICMCIRWRGDDRFWREADRSGAVTLRKRCRDTSRFINLECHWRNGAPAQRNREDEILSKATK